MGSRVLQIILALTIFIILTVGILLVVKLQTSCNKEIERVKKECEVNAFEEKYKQAFRKKGNEKININEHNNSIEFSF